MGKQKEDEPADKAVGKGAENIVYVIFIRTFAALSRKPVVQLSMQR